MRLKIFFGLIFCPALLFAQNEVDALRYSQLRFGGTARFSSMAGAMGALGGDASVLSFNPAGIGIYRTSELTFTPSLHNRYIQSGYNGTPSNDVKYNFNFDNIGLILTKVRAKNDEKNEGWISTSLGLAYNQTNNFHSRMSVVGNSDYSMLNTFAANANGYPPEQLDPFAELLAYKLVLISFDSTNYEYYPNIPEGINVLQKKNIESKGGMGEFAITYGGNYSNKLYIGATLGFANLKYSEVSRFEEIDNKDSIPNLDAYYFDQNLSTKGSGINFKIGLIYRFTDWVRVGGALHTPTFFGMKDSYSSSMTVFDPTITNSLVESSPAGAFEYNLSTPLRATGSLGFVIAKKGLIGIDYEYVNYTNTRLSSAPEVFTDINRSIQTVYAASSNIRAGGEVRFDPFALRAGYAYYGNPFAPNVNNDNHKSSYTLGFGLKGKGMYLDAAYVITNFRDNYFLYDAPVNTKVSNDYSSSSFLLTVGFKY